MTDSCPNCAGTTIAATIPVIGSPPTGKDMVCLDCDFEWKNGGRRSRGW